MTTARRLYSVTLVLVAGTLTLAACNLDPYETGSGGHWRDAGPAPDGDISDDASVIPDACVESPEVCDEQDNDCDGVIDNGFDLQNDVSNCGECGHLCEYFGGLAGCQGGNCYLQDCLPGYHNIDGNDANGCEYYLCFQTNDGTELCDGVDNDCDGDVDEDFDTDTDPQNCGGCNNVCVFLNGNGACVGGQCTLGSCRGGFVDLDTNVNNGCECAMDLSEDATPLTTCVEGANTCGSDELCADPNRDGTSHCLPVPLDLCDGRDNDCDGVVDEDATALLANTDCYTYASGCSDTGGGNYACNGPCHPGTLTCVNGRMQCFGQAGPASESCDNVDNDCNGTVDDQWDKQNDPSNCGSCGNVCTYANAIAGCRPASTPTGAECYMVACLPGYWDNDNDASTGCEYGCTLSNGGVEKCGDGMDNDCDGDTDENFFLDTDPSNCGACGFSCEVNRPTGTQVRPSNTCENSTCHYVCAADSYDIDGDLALGVTAGGTNNTNGCEYLCTVTQSGNEICDGIDNDCDMQVDEDTDFDREVAHCGTCANDCSTKVPPNAHLAGAGGDGEGCSGGQCRFECDAGFVDTNFDLHVIGSDGCDCEITSEHCNGVDDDCNGVVDDASALDCTTFYRDIDQDDYGDPNDATCLCAQNTNLRYTATVAGDCLDTNGNINPDGVEVCDGLDNDCDGNPDNETPGDPTLLSRNCYTGPSGTEGKGICHGGTQSCDSANGRWPDTCQNEQTPLAEVCEGSVDENCDGHIDENTDKLNDKFNCGGCGINCDTVLDALDPSHPLHGPTACDNGNCVYSSCTPPWYDWDGNPDLCEKYCDDQGPPVCDGTGDLNCNNIIDGNEFDKTTDPYNCGVCGKVCGALLPFGMELDTSNGSTGCESGGCVFRCATGFVDLNNDIPTDGCECVQSNGGVEACDGLDNDCNGTVDDGIEKDNDPNNCGNCDFRCSALYANVNLADFGVEVADPACSTGVCRFQCLDRYYDHNNDLGLNQPFGTGVGESDGCEYHCDTDGTGAETCDGSDNDCDGTTDRDTNGDLLSQDCYTGTLGCTPNGSGGFDCAGVCRPGIQLCEGTTGYGACIGQVTPLAPVCGSTADNDCDGQEDRLQFDTDIDPLNCGTCGHSCYNNIPPNMIPDPAGACQGGGCQYVCAAGYRDLDGQAGNGCEQFCEVYPYLDHEKCNGLDDNCDGVRDETTAMEAPPDPDTYCSYPRPSGKTTPCDGVTVACNQGPGDAYPKGWYCMWPSADVQYDTLRPNVVLPVETLCDSVDNNCDGFVDETWPTLDTDCDDGKLGACKGTGKYICNTAKDDVTCNITDVGATPAQETCNNVDDDCDGYVDESKSSTGGLDNNYVVDDMVQINIAGTPTWVFMYEASRPDADSTDEGAAGARACSKENVIPWARVSRIEAEAACNAAGYRLCTQQEWQATCEGSSGPAREYPYIDVGGWGYTDYEPLVCNGNDYDYDCTGLDDDGVIVTGGVESNCVSTDNHCVSYDGVYDLSGNLMEWTSSAAQAGVYYVRGGSFLTHEWGLSCQANFITLDEAFRYDDLGFRCCTTTDPN